MKVKKFVSCYSAIMVISILSAVSLKAQTLATPCTISAPSPWNWWINNVTMTTPGGSTTNPTDKNGYISYSTPVFNINASETNTLKIDVNDNQWINAGTVWFRAWIDFDNNGQFAASEIVLNVTKSSSGGTWVPTSGGSNISTAIRSASGNITVPGGVSGQRRLRVMFKSDKSTGGTTYPAPTDGCDAAGVPVGEVEDYIVSITGGSNPCSPDLTPPSNPTCPANQTLTATGSTATATWTVPTTTDNCTAAGSLTWTLTSSPTANLVSGSAFPIGTTTLTYIAKDAALNSSSPCSFTITVNSSGGGGSGQWTGTTLTENISRSGKVAIGTTNFGNDLSFGLWVKGGIRTEKVKVDLAASNQWADYVFEKNYKLKPLKEVEKYINKNKHLPNIPSSEDLKKEGLDITQMMAKQQEKIEELFLYLIELNKTVANQQLEISRLKEENSGLIKKR